MLILFIFQIIKQLLSKLLLLLSIYFHSVNIQVKNKLPHNCIIYTEYIHKNLKHILKKTILMKKYNAVIYLYNIYKIL